MNFFKTDADVKKAKELNERAKHVRDGGTLGVFRPDDVLELQNYALDIKDIQLYDVLETYWRNYGGRKVKP